MLLKIAYFAFITLSFLEIGCMEKEGFGEEFSICSADFFWRNSGGIKKWKRSDTY